MRTGPCHSLAGDTGRFFFAKASVLFLNIHDGLAEDFTAYRIVGEFRKVASFAAFSRKEGTDGPVCFFWYASIPTCHFPTSK